MRTLQGDHDGSSLRIGVVVSRFNESVTDALLEGALEALEEAKVPSEEITVVSVPGAFEIAGAACKLAASGRADAVVCLGAVIRGQTDHFTWERLQPVPGGPLDADELARVRQALTYARQAGLRVILDLGIPVTFGVLTTDDFEQAEARAGLGDGKAGNKGYEAALDAVEMANLYRLIGYHRRQPW